ncbi:hypothetical protein M2277_005082 [Paenibacillus sp. LBL]|uniref:hypothetical protein n=1 Tax=Paenibacillus sp. LBL TaxID=2940563 RepID=UPI0024770858|nr:hypothetical protein [Paenibacillus sp. LBL]MDH6674390.1 hypothetical protein [Paenibacillus sp. LBL]
MPKLTEAQKQERAQKAQTFDYMSDEAYEEVMSQLDCDCEPYSDVYTLPRWNAQGYMIKKGSKGIKKIVYLKSKEKDAQGNETGRTITRPKATVLFCRCQVKKYQKQ